MVVDIKSAWLRYFNNNEQLILNSKIRRTIMKVTKILALLLAMIMCLSFVACNNGTTTVDSETETQAITDKASTDSETNDTEGGDDLLGDLGGDDGEKLPDGQVIYFEDFQNYSNTTDNSALTTLGWRKMTVDADKVMGEADVKFDFENGRLHVNSWNSGDAIPGHAFYAITQANDDVMKTLMPGGYTLRYDIAYTPDLSGAKNALTSIIMDINENSWTDAAFLPNGVGLYENVTTGKAYKLNSNSIAVGNTLESSISGVLLNKAPDNNTIPMLNVSVTIMVKVDPTKGPIYYVKKSADPDTAFVKIGEAVMDNGYVGWLAAASRALALHTCKGLNAYYDNILVYSGLGDCPVTIVPDNFNGSTAGQEAGNGKIYYFEDFNLEDSFANNVMRLDIVEGTSEQLMQDLGITCVSDGGLTTYMWIDSGRLLISNFSGYEGDTREKDTTGKYSFFKIAALDDAVKMAALYNEKFTIQYDIAYGCKDVNGDGALDIDTASWAAMFDIILNMDGANGVACGISAGGFVRLDYLTTDNAGTTNELLTDVSLMNRGQVLGNKLRESDVGAITVRIVVDPATNTIKLYAKTAGMSEFVLAGTTSALSDGYDSLVAATSNSIGFALQYGNNALLDNLIVYSGNDNPPETNNQDNYYKAQ